MRHTLRPTDPPRGSSCNDPHAMGPSSVAIAATAINCCPQCRLQQRHPHHHHQLPLPSTTPLLAPLAPSHIPLLPPLMTTAVDKGGEGTLASVVTIAAASANVTAPLTLLSMVGCCVITPHLLCCPPSEFVIPCRRAIVNAFAAGPPSPFAYHRQPLPCHSFTHHILFCRSR